MIFYIFQTIILDDKQYVYQVVYVRITDIYIYQVEYQTKEYYAESLCIMRYIAKRSSF